MVAETAHHAGHADILRETIDSRGGRDREEMGDEECWTAFVAKVQAAADAAPRDPADARSVARPMCAGAGNDYGLSRELETTAASTR